MGDVGLLTLAVIAAAVLVGSVTQSVVGLGLGLVAAPVTTLVAPQLMPGAMLIVVSVFPVLTLLREREDIDWRGLAWAMPPRVVGTAFGVWVVATVDERGLGIGVGLMVLVAVVLTARTIVIPVNRGTLSTAGFVSGVTGTATSIGGPPLALLYQHRPPRQLRTTLAVYFLLGSVLSMVGLGAGGELTLTQLAVALSMMPVLLVGAAVSGPLKRRLPPEVVRPAVLVICGASALALLVRSIVG